MSMEASKDWGEENVGQATAISGKRQEMGSALACPTPRGIDPILSYNPSAGNWVTRVRTPTPALLFFSVRFPTELTGLTPHGLSMT